MHDETNRRWSFRDIGDEILWVIFRIQTKLIDGSGYAHRLRILFNFDLSARWRKSDEPISRYSWNMRILINPVRFVWRENKLMTHPSRSIVFFIPKTLTKTIFRFRSNPIQWNFWEKKNIEKKTVFVVFIYNILPYMYKYIAEFEKKCWVPPELGLCPSTRTVY